MSASPQDILHSFDVLPEADQRVVAVEIIRRASKWESVPLTDEDLCRQADELFLALDQREADNGPPAAK